VSLAELGHYIKSGERCHLVGIGGASMSALAEILHGQGINVSGSDINESPVISRIRALGIDVMSSHRAENIEGAGYIIRTAAAREDNVEIKAARAKGIPVFERGQAWGYIMSWYKNAICVAGVHGKTTTTSMVTHILLAAEVDPTIMIGGTLPILGSGYRVGNGDYIALESCEYYNSFHNFCPTVAVILNVDTDHLDFFKDLDDLKNSFRKFASLVPDAGYIVCNGDDGNTMEALAPLGRDLFTFGFGEIAVPYDKAAGLNAYQTAKASIKAQETEIAAGLQPKRRIRRTQAAQMHSGESNIAQQAAYGEHDGQMLQVAQRVKSYRESHLHRPHAIPIRVRGVNVNHIGQNPSMDILYDGEPLCKITLQIPGIHNLRNALASIAACLALGIPVRAIENGLFSYKGVGRRFEYKGSINGAVVYDDYAHHPSELCATLDSVSTLGYKRVILAFQPHTFSRTKALFDDFVTELSRPDITIIAPIYAAREKDDRTISSKVLADAVPGALCYGSLQEITDMIAGIAKEGDIILTAGAGDIHKVGEGLTAHNCNPGENELK